MCTTHSSAAKLAMQRCRYLMLWTLALPFPTSHCTLKVFPFSGACTTFLLPSESILLFFSCIYCMLWLTAYEKLVSRNSRAQWLSCTKRRSFIIFDTHWPHKVGLMITALGVCRYEISLNWVRAVMQFCRKCRSFWTIVRLIYMSKSEISSGMAMVWAICICRLYVIYFLRLLEIAVKA